MTNKGMFPLSLEVFIKLYLFVFVKSISLIILYALYKLSDNFNNTQILYCTLHFIAITKTSNYMPETGCMIGCLGIYSVRG